MRALVLSDLHGNLEAAERALHLARSAGPVDALWFLGDVLGFHTKARTPDTIKREIRSHDLKFSESLDWLKENKALCVKGNWENWTLQAGRDGDGPNQPKWAPVLEVMRDSLTRDQLDYVSGWEDWRTDEASRTLLFHTDPNIREGYIETRSDVQYTWSEKFTAHGFQQFAYGHTHRCGVYFAYQDADTCAPTPHFKRLWPDRPVEMRRQDLWLAINPGSASALEQKEDNQTHGSALLIDFAPAIIKFRRLNLR